MFSLHPDWYAIFTRAWSVRFLALSFGADAAELTLTKLPELMSGVPAGAFLGASIGLKGFAVIARFVAQKNMAAAS
jgi:hypothetical protein